MFSLRPGFGEAGILEFKPAAAVTWIVFSDLTHESFILLLGLPGC
jgi:hypothetical protein